MVNDNPSCIPRNGSAAKQYGSGYGTESDWFATTNTSASCSTPTSTSQPNEPQYDESTAAKSTAEF